MITTLDNFYSLGSLKNGVYKITNPIGRVYIGQFTSSINRFKMYRLSNKQLKAQKFLYNSIIKYGLENHNLEILTLNQKSENLDKYEQAFIRYYDSYNNGMNCTIGGGGRIKYSDEFCHRCWELNKSGLNSSQISLEMNIDRRVVLYLIERTGNKFIKHPWHLTEEHKAVNRKAQVGRKHSNEQNIKTSIAKKIIVPTVAKDENDVYQLVYPKPFNNYRKSDWHLACRRLYMQQKYYMAADFPKV